MRIGRFRDQDGSEFVFATTADGVFNLQAAGGPASISAAMSALDSGTLSSFCRPEAAVDPTNLVALAPVDPDVRVLCTGFNYGKHAAEAGRDTPSNPTFFQRYRSSLVGPGEPIILPHASEQLDWEGEIAFVISRCGRAIPRAQALEHVGGYVCFGDHSVRDYQLHGSQATAGKNFDRTGAIGPWIVTPDEAPAPQNQELFTRLNDEQVQHGRLSDLIFDVPALINYISTFMTLRPGDVVATGTPAGIGGRRTPPRWMRAGEEITIDVPGVGILSNPVIAEGQAA